MLDEDPAPPRKGAQQPPPHFSVQFALARSPISATAELLSLLATQHAEYIFTPKTHSITASTHMTRRF